jgi:hypothetical protein
MQRTAQLLAQISAVEETMGAPESAYLFRTRLQRLTLACARVVARERGIPEPVLPGRFEIGPQSSARERELANCLNTITEVTELLGRPSEPFDDRWERHRLELTSCLSTLRQLVQIHSADTEAGLHQSPAC